MTAWDSPDSRTRAKANKGFIVGNDTRDGPVPFPPQDEAKAGRKGDLANKRNFHRI